MSSTSSWLGAAVVVAPTVLAVVAALVAC